MIEIFKTNINNKSSVKQIVTVIHAKYPGVIATCDLDDHDKILRVVGAWTPVPTQEIIDLVKSQGFLCEMLND